MLWPNWFGAQCCAFTAGGVSIWLAFAVTDVAAVVMVSLRSIALRHAAHR
jgi:hypothetical protein